MAELHKWTKKGMLVVSDGSAIPTKESLYIKNIDFHIVRDAAQQHAITTVQAQTSALDFSLRIVKARTKLAKAVYGECDGYCEVNVDFEKLILDAIQMIASFSKS